MQPQAHWLDHVDERVRHRLRSGLQALTNLRDDVLLRRVWAGVADPMVVLELDERRRRVRRRWALALVAVVAATSGLFAFL